MSHWNRKVHLVEASLVTVSSDLSTAIRVLSPLSLKPSSASNPSWPDVLNCETAWAAITLSNCNVCLCVCVPAMVQCVVLGLVYIDFQRGKEYVHVRRRQWNTLFQACWLTRKSGSIKEIDPLGCFTNSATAKRQIAQTPSTMPRRLAFMVKLADCAECSPPCRRRGSLSRSPSRCIFPSVAQSPSESARVILLCLEEEAVIAGQVSLQRRCSKHPTRGWLK